MFYISVTAHLCFWIVKLISGFCFIGFLFCFGLGCAFGALHLRNTSNSDERHMNETGIKTIETVEIHDFISQN